LVDSDPAYKKRARIVRRNPTNGSRWWDFLVSVQVFF
jgi:hypothetical protein